MGALSTVGAIPCRRALDGDLVTARLDGEDPPADHGRSGGIGRLHGQAGPQDRQGAEQAALASEILLSWTPNGLEGLPPGPAYGMDL